mmetsp:Transcript_19444/g.45251  ORF Transcript_19444/g.45251 Transcript_19444/m.45251 type:complete len:251 (+) Transcript_19444:317-1069(+)
MLDDHSMQTMPTMAASIRFNNIGVACIESGDYENAIETFKHAMTTLKGAIEVYVRARKRRRHHSNHSPRPEVEAKFEHTLRSEDLEQLSIHHRRPDQQGNDQDADLFVFRCPLRIADDKECFPESYTEISIIMTYNLALAHHLDGLETDEEGEVLMKSLELYGMTLDLLLRDQSFKHNTVIFTTAILNNMGQIHYLLGNEQLSTKFFKRMLSIIMIELASNRKEELENHLDGFFYNINQFIYKKPSAPAA